MIELEGYAIIDALTVGEGIAVYRAVREGDKTPVTIKWAEKIAGESVREPRLRNELEISQSLESAGIIRALGLERNWKGTALILEDYGGLSLREHIKKQAPDTETFLRWAIRLCEILGEVHQANIIHKDINPANIVVNPLTSVLKLTEFGISTLLPLEERGIVSPGRLEGTLAYMSPEQTGRMNRVIDYRTDFYSLGVTFYEILTGRLPFEAYDALEVIYGHIARRPEPPSALNPDLPAVISDIVMKLMAKNAEDRYRSTFGLSEDLKACLRQFNEIGRVDAFKPGTRDRVEKFYVSRKLYGRKSQMAGLWSGFEQVGDGEKALALVSGYSGVGKSALVRELHKPITEARGYFIAGKFEQYRRDIPYSALIRAFTDLIEQILTESPDRIEDWRDVMEQALGANGRIIVNVIPQVELIMGPLSPVAELPPGESESRFNQVFRDFVGVFARREHLLTIFLDDLQWADEASLRLLGRLIRDQDLKYFYVVGAYRDNEVESHHPLHLFLDDVREGGVKVEQIPVEPLNRDQVNRVITDTLECESSVAAELAELVHAKTRGNPFFVNEFLKSLYTEKLLRFDFADGAWKWSLAEIHEREITANVVDLLAGKIRKLNEDTRDMLRHAACIGHQFTADVLRMVTDMEEARADRLLREAIAEGLLMPVGAIPAAGRKSERGGGMYRFPHDQVHQAAYSLIDPEKRGEVHLDIARYRVKKSGGEEIHEGIFDILNHFNAARRLLEDPDERLRVAEMNMLAARRARESSAYAQALTHAAIGIELLPADGWKNNYRLTLSLHMERAVNSYLTGSAEQADDLFSEISRYATSREDLSDMYLLQLQLHTSRSQHERSLKLFLKALAQHGLNLNPRPGKLSVLMELLKTGRRLRNRTAAELLDSPPARDPDILAVQAIIFQATSGSASAYFKSKELLALVSLKAVNLSLKYGSTRYDSVSYMTYAVILAVFGKYEQAAEFGRLALELQRKYDERRPRCGLNFAMGRQINIWTRPLRESMPYLHHAYRAGLENGDMVFGGYAASNIPINTFMQGDPLDNVRDEFEKYLPFLRQARQEDAYRGLSILRQTVLALTGNTTSPDSMNEGDFDESEFEAALRREDMRSILFWYFLFKSQLYYLNENYREALRASEEARKIMEIARGAFHYAEHFYYDSLCLAAAADASSGMRKYALLRRMAANIRQLKIWQEHCPTNFRHKYLLARAEEARLRGHAHRAARLYNQAADGAEKSEFIQDAALACEKAADFWRGENGEWFANRFTERSFDYYRLWGAKAKLAIMRARFPELARREPGRRRSDDPRKSSLSDIAMGDNLTPASDGALDLASVLKASQSLAGEIKLEGLLGKLMQIVMENAGARRGYLLLNREGELIVECEYVLDEHRMSVNRNLALGELNHDTRMLSVSIVQYAARTHKNVVVGDAMNEPRFEHDRYITRNRIRSVLCLPILHQGRLTGVLYLENNLNPGVFTPARLEVLKLLSSQTAISLENAGLYSQMEEKVRQRTRKLHETLMQVQDLKNQQDGDYYLTTVIADPLFKNWNKSKQVSTDFFIKQKKSFTFRKWYGQLGGDICVSGNLNFGGRRFTMFMNGDAMGKSMQGAGGAIVMGTIMNSIMHRSASGGRVLEISPAEWLRNAYEELQGAFSTFDGSMCISCVLGVVDDETGEMSFFNAEHPFSVLLRDGEAVYLEKEYSSRKIGFRSDLEFKILTFNLRPGDVIVAGSDGRDDVDVSRGDEPAVMNEDDSMILRLVEKSGGDLNELVRSIRREGEITDDISLIRLGFQESEAAAESRGLPPEQKLSRAETMIERKEYSRALDWLDDSGGEVLYLRGLCLSKLNRYSEALESLEEALAMDPNRADVRRLMGRIYFSRGDYRGALRLFEEAGRLDPEHAGTRNALRKLRHHSSDTAQPGGN